MLERTRSWVRRTLEPQPRRGGANLNIVLPSYCLDHSVGPNAPNEAQTQAGEISKMLEAFIETLRNSTMKLKADS